MTSDPFPPRRSADGRVEVRFSAYEARMSHWVLEPVVVRTRDQHVVVSLEGSDWDGGTGVTFPAPDRVALALRRYPDGAYVEHVTVDVETGRFGLGAGATPSEPVAGLARTLEATFEQTVARRTAETLAQHRCPYCLAQLYDVRPGRPVTCLVCDRHWPASV